MDQSFAESLRGILSACLGRTIGQVRLDPVSGGSINRSFRVQVQDNLRFFCKINSSCGFPSLFEKERNGLRLLRSAGALHVPEVLALQEISGTQILVMEWIETGPRPGRFWQHFGEGLAHLHQVTQPYFGLGEDNYMGSMHQSNLQSISWCEFFAEKRLTPQLDLALLNHLLDASQVRHFKTLFKKLESIFQPGPPALLHGDLWSGNFLSDQHGHAVLIDPAVYFGNPGMDLGMTTLFGGFEKAFYEAYHYHSPFPANYRQQWEICNLYPLLIHLNLFGRSYLPQILRTIQSY
jgi:fructosamine-3-kinase